MNEQEWRKLLKTYRSPKRVAAESLEGVVDHLQPCRTGQRSTEYVRNQYSGVGPVDVPAVCTRGTKGCNLDHNDVTALKFNQLAFERILELV